MVAAAIFAIALHQGPNNVRANRITFYNAMLKVRRGWTGAQVKAVLGPPDDIRKDKDLQNFSDATAETWCYGSSGHMGFPVLGDVWFEHGRVEEPPAWKENPPQSESAISDRELFPVLRRFESAGLGEDDPLFYIRTTNLLQPLGKAKAVAVLFEYDRLSQGQIGHFDTDDRMFWLIHFLFVPKNPHGYFQTPMIGGIFPSPSKLQIWPTFPTIEVDDVPFVYPVNIILGGVPESFGWYLRDHEKDWTIRPKPMRPPNNPFTVWPAVRALPVWKRMAVDQPKSDIGHGEALRSELLKLVRTAADSEEGFRALHCRWDVNRQMYVRGDGSFQPDAGGG